LKGEFDNLGRQKDDYVNEQVADKEGLFVDNGFPTVRESLIDERD